MTAADVDLSVPDTTALRARRSTKWTLWDPDVLSLSIAEMARMARALGAA